MSIYIKTNLHHKSATILQPRHQSYSLKSLKIHTQGAEKCQKTPKMEIKTHLAHIITPRGADERRARKRVVRARLFSA